jgi:hypothetical protein
MTSIIELFFDKEDCVLGFWLRSAAYTGHILCFRRGGPKAGRRVLGLNLLAKGSRVRYYRSSHREELPTTEGERFLHEVSQSVLVAVGC